MIRRFFSGILLFSFLLGFCGPLQAGEAEYWKVAKVIDGDTLIVKMKKRKIKVRLIGVDTPEKYESEKLEKDVRRTHQDEKVIRHLGKKASEFAQKLVQGRSVRLAYGDQATDRYGRTLAYVFFQMSEDQFGKKACVPFPKKGRPPLQKEYMLNRVLVQCGYAYAFTRFPFALEREFVQLQREAEARERGLWKPDSKHRALAAVPETKSPRPKGDLEE